MAGPGKSKNDLPEPLEEKVTKSKNPLDSGVDMVEGANDTASDITEKAADSAVDTASKEVNEADKSFLEGAKYNAKDNEFLKMVDQLTDMVANIQGSINGAVESAAKGAVDTVTSGAKKALDSAGDMLSKGFDSVKNMFSGGGKDAGPEEIEMEDLSSSMPTPSPGDKGSNSLLDQDEDLGLKQLFKEDETPTPSPGGGDSDKNPLDSSVDVAKGAGDTFSDVADSAVDTASKEVNEADKGFLEGAKYNSDNEFLKMVDQLTDMVADIQGSINGAVESAAKGAVDTVTSGAKKAFDSAGDMLKSGGDMLSKGVDSVKNMFSGGDKNSGPEEIEMEDLSSSMPTPSPGDKGSDSLLDKDEDLGLDQLFKEDDSPSLDGSGPDPLGAVDNVIEVPLQSMDGSSPSSPLDMFKSDPKTSQTMDSFGKSADASNSAQMGELSEAAPALEEAAMVT